MEYQALKVEEVNIMLRVEIRHKRKSLEVGVLMPSKRNILKQRSKLRIDLITRIEANRPSHLTENKLKMERLPNRAWAFCHIHKLQ